MEQTHCRADAKHIRHFLNLCEGNWHSCIYVRCSPCQIAEPCSTPDFLFHPDETGSPCVLPFSDAALLFARTPEPEECLGQMTMAEFQQLYQPYLIQNGLTGTSCPSLFLLRLQEAAQYDW